MNTHSKNMLFMALCFFLGICFGFFIHEKEPKENTTQEVVIRPPQRQCLPAKSDDDNWTTSALIYCDSVDMVSQTHAIYWIDGRCRNLHGKMIKIYMRGTKYYKDGTD